MRVVQPGQCSNRCALARAPLLDARDTSSEDSRMEDIELSRSSKRKMMVSTQAQ